MKRSHNSFIPTEKPLVIVLLSDRLSPQCDSMCHLMSLNEITQICCPAASQSANQGWEQDVAAEHLSPTRVLHYATQGGAGGAGGGGRGNLIGRLIFLKKN